MSYVIAFFRNKWTKIGFSALSLGYGFFVIWLAWLVYSFHLVPTNPVSLFSLYLMINVLFGTVMVYTRKEIATQVVACMLHPCILVMLVFAFGNWWLLVPVFIISSVVFFAAGSPESLKTILGTIYLILFVLTVLGYMTLQIFSINIIHATNIELRSPDYLYSTNSTYRLVKYIDKENVQNRNVNYFIEFAAGDIKLPFLEGERQAGSILILSQGYERNPHVEWISDTEVFADGRVYIAPDFKPRDENDDDDFMNETEIFLPPGERTQATTTPPPAAATFEEPPQD
jgi:hypothetical protein